MIEIDGSQGEGGGQMLRTALSLSCITGQGFRIRNIRKSRSKPGLMPQHLVAVQAAARISGAKLSGDRLRSVELSFAPGRVKPGEYSFDIGTAGSTPLVLQTIIPPLFSAGAKSWISLVGGTHLPFSPSWHYLHEVFAPTLRRLGADLDLTLDRCGFYPKGGGKVRCLIHPHGNLSPLNQERRGRLLRVTGCAAVGNLPRHIAEREAAAALATLRGALGAEVPIDIEIQELSIYGQGTFIFLKAEYEDAVSGFTVLGERGKLAERVGEEAAHELLDYRDSGMPIDQHLADQLVLYLAQAKAPSLFATSRITAHLETNLLITGYFLDIGTQIKGELNGPGTVLITPHS